MIEFLNGLQPGAMPEGLTSSKGAGTSAEAQALAGGSEFGKLLDQMKKGGASDSDLLAMMSQNMKGGQDVAVHNALKQGLDQNLENMMAVEGEGLLPEMLADQILSTGEAKQTGKATLEGELAQNLQQAKTPNQLRMSLPKGVMTNQAAELEQVLQPNELTNVKTPEMKGAQTNAAVTDMKSVLSNAQNGQEVDARIAPQLHSFSPKKGKGTSQTQIHYSEDFMTQRIEQNGSEKPKIVGNRKAMNMFQQEQSVLSDTGIIKKKSATEMNIGKMDFDTSSKEKVSSKFDNIQAVSETTTNSGEQQADKLATLMTPKTQTLTAVSTAGSDVKVLDLSSVKNPEQLLSEISNYIENSRIQHGKEIEVIVKHNDLGQFKINAQKGKGDLIDLKIIANSDEAHNFFNKNEVSLLKTLSTQGVKVADFKLSMGESSSTSSNGNNSSDQNSTGNGQGFARNYNSGDDMSRDGRQRRQQLWDQYRERLGA